LLLDVEDAANPLVEVVEDLVELPLGAVDI
jgi:hypothetical protein